VWNFSRPVCHFPFYDKALTANKYPSAGLLTAMGWDNFSGVGDHVRRQPSGKK
jgi:hypothetical protein